MQDKNQAGSAAGSQLGVLVIDPNPGIRASLQDMLGQAGITRVESALNANAAVKLLARKRYDIILCEYDLGGNAAGGASAGSGGQDGQQLLEDLRRHALIPPWTIFIMLTSEVSPDRVLGAAELQPTDYVVKPFTARTLNARLLRALERRAALLPAWQAAQDDPAAAIAACIASAKSKPRYALDFARLRAELLASLDEHAAAASVYREVLADKPLGWARLGLARADAAQGRFEDAIAGLTGLVADNPRLMAAYDLLARCQARRGLLAEARKTLEDAVAISPHIVGRLRRLGDVALDSGDAPAAERAFRQVLARARHSEFRSPEDHVKLVQALVRQGDAAGAGAVIRDLERSLRGAPATPACQALSAALLHEAAGDPAGAVAGLKQAVEALRAGAALSCGLRVDLARACLAQRMDDDACEVMLGALQAAPRTTTLATAQGADDALSPSQAAAVFAQAGRADLADGMQRQLRAQAQVLLGVADEKRNMGDVRGAVQTLLDALALAPKDVQVMIAVAGGILRQVLEMGWDHPLAALCGQQLAQVRTLDPAHPRLRALEEDMALAKRKYGIAG